MGGGEAKDIKTKNSFYKSSQKYVDKTRTMNFYNTYFPTELPQKNNSEVVVVAYKEYYVYFSGKLLK